MKKLFASFIRWWDSLTPIQPVMLVHYDPATNLVRCEDWISKEIPALTGVLTTELFEEIKKHCCTGIGNHTCIYIWGGIEKGHLAYNENIDPYLEDPQLWKTGRSLPKRNLIDSAFASASEAAYSGPLARACSTKPASEIYKDLTKRLRDINFIIIQGNYAFNVLNRSGKEEILYRSKYVTGGQIVKELTSYGQEREMIMKLVEFYEDLGIV